MVQRRAVSSVPNLTQRRRLWRSRRLKYAIERVDAAILLIFLAPLLLIIAFLVRVNLGSPVLFRQARPGENGKLFEMVKFRTMRDAIGSDGRPLPDAERLTRFGKLLRATSLDELPELWNVVRGEMAMIGPRPLLPAYLTRYNARQARRHEMRPGITGWAQVNGRNTLDWETRFELDVQYVDHWDHLLDVKIGFMTLAKVFKRSGVSAEGHATMPEFMGTEGQGPARSAPPPAEESDAAPASAPTPPVPESQRPD